MNNNTIQAVKTYLAEVGADGHSIFNPDMLLRMGFDKELVDRHTFTEKSGKGKYQIYDANGNPAKELRGVYSLNFMYAIAEVVKADTTNAKMKTGRGFQAQELYKAIQDAVNALESIRKEEGNEVTYT